MEGNLQFDFEVAIRLMLAFGIGTMIGLEREYHSKAAGLRTMIMICLGSTIFTLISISIGGDSTDRIASNIITGIGFLGAGVIFKDGLNISGITTATAIWICAALGMAVGTGQYILALLGSVIVLIVLSVLQRVTVMVEHFHQGRSYTILYRESMPFLSDMESEMKRLNLKFQKRKDFKQENEFVVLYEIYGKENNLELLNVYLKRNESVKKYEY